MSIFGALRSGVSGLNAQSQAMSMISDNIANANTTGYKKVSATFGNMITTQTTATAYTPGGVSTRTLRSVSEQGLMDSSTNSTDMAIDGAGFFAVTDNVIMNDVTSEYEITGEVFYTRAGQFYPDQNGNLKTPQGYYLLGWARNEDNTEYNVTNVIKSFDVINVATRSIQPVPTSTIALQANLQSSTKKDGEFSISSPIIDRLGASKTLKMTFTKNGDDSSDTTSLVWDITGTVSDNAYFAKIGSDTDGDGLPNGGYTSDVLATDGSGSPLANVNLGKLSFNADGTLKHYIPPVYHNDIVTVRGTVVDSNLDGVADGIDLNSYDGSDIEDTDNDASTANIVGTVDLDGDGIADRMVDLTIPDANYPPYSVTNNTIKVYYMNSDRTGYVAEDGSTPVTTPVVKYSGTLLTSGVDQYAGLSITLSDNASTPTFYYVNQNEEVYTIDATTNNKDIVGTIDADGLITLSSGTSPTTAFTGYTIDGDSLTTLGNHVEFYGVAVDTSVYDSDDADLEDDDGIYDGVVDQIDILLPGEYNLDADGNVTLTGLYDVTTDSVTGEEKWIWKPDGIDTYDLADLDIVTDGSLFATKYANDVQDPAHEIMLLAIDYDGDYVTTENNGDRVLVQVDFGVQDGNTGMHSDNSVSSITKVTQNGKEAGTLTGVAVNSSGEVSGIFDNGSTRQMYQVPVITFPDPNSLNAQSNNVFSQTDASGEGVAHVANTGGAGVISPATLEESTVDIADEFTKMIVTQRAYSANTKVITTADDMLTELINSKR